MKQIKIEIPAGFEIDSFDQATGEIKFKQKPTNPIERIKTDDDVLTDNGFTCERFNEWCDGLEEHERATRFIGLLVKSLNQGWTPDFDNDNQYKYQPWFLGGSSGFRFHGYGDWRSASYVGSRLCFKSRELAEHAGKNFTRWYKKTIITK